MRAWVRRALAGRRARWEALCRRCGLCCFEKEYRGRTVVINEDSPCLFLDTRRRSCRIYARRFDACPHCKRMTIFHALFVRWLPEECGYVRYYRRWLAIGRRRPA